MVQVVEQQDFGAQLGSSLGSGLETLIGAKVKGMQDRQKLQLQSELKRGEQKEKFQQLMQLLGGAKDPSQDSVEIDETEDILGRPQGKNISDEQILAVSLIEPNLGRILQSQKDAVTKHEDRLDERAFKRNEAYNKRVDEAAFNRSKLNLALDQMEGALSSGDFESWSNIVGDLTGFEKLKTAPAQVVNSAAKEFLVGALGELTGRPNQWIEQQISRALINPQYAPQANQLIFKGLRGLQSLRDKEIETRNQIEAEFEKKGREPRNIQALVQKRMAKDIDNFENNYRKELESLTKKVEEADKPLKKPSKGTPLDKDSYRKIRARSKSKEEALETARKMGYEF